jgi:3-oxoacyl-[acyl-carrier protein] reductase
MEEFVGVVTGGTRGIGLGIAECLVKRNASIALTYHRDDQAAEKAHQKLSNLVHNDQKILLLKGDAGDPETVASHHQTIRHELGPVTILVNNAGIMPSISFDEISIDQWKETIRINLDSAFYWCHKVIPEMKQLNFGRIINISSIAARGGGVIGPHYAAAKAGMLGLTRYAARELGPHGITINAIAPAFIEDAGIFADWSESDKDKLKQKVVVPRLGNVEDIARAIEYLLDSPFVTGVTLDINGGAFMI